MNGIGYFQKYIKALQITDGRDCNYETFKKPNNRNRISGGHFRDVFLIIRDLVPYKVELSNHCCEYMADMINDPERHLDMIVSLEIIL